MILYIKKIKAYLLNSDFFYNKKKFKKNKMRKHSTKTIEKIPPNSQRKRSIELIKEFLSNQPKEINKLESTLDIIYNVINSFIELTRDYSQKITQQALNIAADYTVEGRLAQAVQNIFLFYTEELNNLTSELSKVNVKMKEKEQMSLLDKFNEQKNKYFQKANALVAISAKYRNEISLY